MKSILSILIIFVSAEALSQTTMSPELLWKLGRMSGKGLSKDGKSFIYQVSNPDVDLNKSTRTYWSLPLDGGAATQVPNADSLMTNSKISPDGKYIIYTKEVPVFKMTGADRYPDLPKSNAYVYDDLNYRHWDEWEDGKFSHVFLATLVNGKPTNEIDLMAGEPHDCPQKPFGGEEDYIWSRDGKSVLYVTKKKFGKAYALSTNTDLYQYNIATRRTTNLTSGMMGYDVNPEYSSKGELAWLSMRREGYEADKNDIVILRGNNKINLTKNRDDITVAGFTWSNDGSLIYFWAPYKATEQLFSVATTAPYTVRQITTGDHQITKVEAETPTELIVTLVNFNQAPELYAVNKASGALRKLTSINDDIYKNVAQVKAEMRTVKTTDGLAMPTWVIYPPGFDAKKKYPTLLFCLGGPQSTTPHYSFRWNLQLIASQGYIVVAPDRRGVYGNGTKWTEAVSKDWAGQVMRDYLSAIDEVSKEPFVDKSRRGAVGASFGGYSVFMLEAMNNGRFKSFISHDGVFDFKSMYGTTEELFFVNWDLGGSYWEKNNAAAKRAYENSPSNFVEKWNTPILIVQGGKDYRVPIEQGLQAFQAAQLRGIKSRLLYLPDENHWVLTAQNALVWQREFFKWLKETLYSIDN
jgi:dipeptidyl aminopeptidase/acylaminoacyl peptidase